MSVLTLINDVTRLLFSESTTSVLTSEDTNVIKLSSLLLIEGDELSKSHGWRKLKQRDSIAGDGVSSNFAIPEDFTRFAPGEVMWEVGGVWQTLKHVSDEEMLALQSDSVSILRPVWRFYGDDIQFYPTLPAGQVLNYEYRSEYWVTDSSGTTGKPRPTADSDLFRLPENLLKLGLIWRFRQDRGLNYDEDFRSYQNALSRYTFNDAPHSKIRIGRKVINDGLAAGMYGDVRVIVP